MLKKRRKGKKREGDLGVRGVAEEVEEVGGLQNAGRDLFGGESLERGAALRVGRHSCHPRVDRASLLMFPLSASSNHPGSSALGRFILLSRLLCFYVFSLSLSLPPSDSRSGGVLWLLSFIRFATVAAWLQARNQPRSLPPSTSPLPCLHLRLPVPRRHPPRPFQDLHARSPSTSPVSGPPYQVPPTSPLRSRPGWRSQTPPTVHPPPLFFTILMPRPFSLGGFQCIIAQRKTRGG